MFEAGTTIRTHQGHTVTLSEVTPGDNGVMLVGTYADGLAYGTYVPYELPPPAKIAPHGWRRFNALYWFEVHGRRFPALSLRRRDGSGFDLPHYEAAWAQSFEP